MEKGDRHSGASRQGNFILYWAPRPRLPGGACGARSGQEKGYGNFMNLLRMRCYGDDRNHSSSGAIIPENPVSARCFLMDISFKDLFPVGAFERAKFMCVQRGMAQVGFEKPQAFSDDFKGIFFRGIILNLPKICVGLGGENQFVHGILFSMPGERSAFDGSLLRKAGQDFP